MLSCVFPGVAHVFCRYMEEIVEGTLALLSLHSETSLGPLGTDRVLVPLHLLALLDTKATWFKKWMVGFAYWFYFILLFFLGLVLR